MMKRLKKLPIHLILIGLGFFFLLPFIWMLSTALKSDQQVLVNPPIWIPKPVSYTHLNLRVTFQESCWGSILLTSQVWRTTRDICLKPLELSLIHI